MVLRNGVDFQAVDDQPVKLIFLIAAPNTKDNVHLEVLSSLSVLLLDEDFSKNLINATTKEELLSIIDEAESKAKEEKAADPAKGDTVKLTTKRGEDFEGEILETVGDAV